MTFAYELSVNSHIMFAGLTYQINDIDENDIGDLVLTLIIPKPLTLEEMAARIVVIMPKDTSVRTV